MARFPREYEAGWPKENAIFRTAKREYVCGGSGVRPCPDCIRTIRVGDQYIEYVGEVPAYQRGSAHCVPCALAFEFIRRTGTV